MDLDIPAEDEAFRDGSRAWLTEHSPPDVDVADDRLLGLPGEPV